MQGNGQHTGYGTKPEGNHENQREHNFRHGAGKFETAARDKTRKTGQSHVAACQKAAGKGAQAAHHCADIGDQQCLAHQPQPFFPAPEPFRQIGQDRSTRLEMSQTADIAGQITEMGKEFHKIDFGNQGGHKGDSQQKTEAQQSLAAFDRHRLCIEGQQSRSLCRRQRCNGRSAVSPRLGRHLHTQSL